MKSTLALCLVVALAGCFAPSLRADEGNGVGQAFIRHTAAVIGGSLNVEFGSRNLPFGSAFVVVSDGIGPVIVPVVGTVCLDINSPAADVAISTNLDGNGGAGFSVPIPGTLPTLVTFPPFYLMCGVIDPTTPFPSVSFSKTVRVNFENPDSYNPGAGTLLAPRALHTATAMGGPEDNRTKVLVAGGGNGTLLSPVSTFSTEIYQPLTRSYVAGPNMSEARSLHTAVRLQDGRVLIMGGTDTVGIVSASCEIYDPATNAFSATGSMASVRAGHAATLRSDGSVVVSGGVTTFVGGATGLAAVLNTVQNSVEVFDPAAAGGVGAWSTVASTMQVGRFGQTQTLLANGDILIAGGIDGGTTVFGQGLPTYTATCDILSAAGVVSATGSFPTGANRGGHGASRLPTGDVLVTGGLVAGALSVPATTPSCLLFTSGSWTTTAPMGTARALHTQLVSTSNGEAVLHGGIDQVIVNLFPSVSITFSTTSTAERHDGVSAIPRNMIGSNPGFLGSMPAPTGLQASVRLHDDTILIVGGANGNLAVNNSFVFQE